MKKIHFLITLITAFFAFMSRAAYLENIPVTVKQPDGQILNCFATGDEYYNWLHDARGYTIIQDHKNGFYVYAELKNGELSPTYLLPGKDDPAIAGLLPYTNISPEKMISIRNKILAETPAAPVNRDPKRKGISQAPNQGTMNNIVIFIRFKADTEYNDLVSLYDNMFNGGAGVNSVKNYYEEMSYNKLHINSSFFPIPSGSTIISYQDTSIREYFMPYDSVTNPLGYKSSQRTDREFNLLKRAVDNVSSQIPAGLDIDYNNDGNVDNVVFVIYGATTAWNTLLWPHRWSLYGVMASINGKRVWDFNLQVRDHLKNSGAGVLCHEMFHSLGAPDLYHYKSHPVTPVGKWDIMASTTNPPQAMGAYMKYKYGKWYDTIPEIKTCGRYTLNPVTATSNIAYRIPSPNSTTEFFIVEYRVKQGTFEKSIPGTGLIIYRINTIANGNASGPPDEIYVYRPNGDTNKNGVIDSAYFSANVNKTSFNYTTNPNCFLSNKTDGGINISNISEAGNTISFTLNFKNVKPSADFSAGTTNTCAGKVISFTEYSACYATSWQWTITPGTYQFVNSTTASSPNPQVKFNADGKYTVSLKVSNANGSDTKTVTDYITIGTGIKTPFAEDFETASFSPNLWEVNNPDTGITWALTAKPKGNGTSKNCVYLNFYSYLVKGKTDDLISRNINLSNKDVAYLKFKVAYRRYNAASKDSLKIFISTNCGVNYDTFPVYSKSGDALRTSSNTTSEFFPNYSSEWRTDSVNLNKYTGKNIIIRFQGINDHGNNLFLDDINVEAYKIPSAGFTISDTEVCEHSMITFTDTSSGDITSKTWIFPGGNPNTSGSDNPVVTYDTTGIYPVKLIVYYKTLADTEEIKNLVKIDSYPGKPVVSWDYDNYQFISSSDFYNQWYDENGLISGATGKTYKPAKTGFYYLLLDNHGCISESSDTFSINTGLAEVFSKIDLSVYPNPNQGIFHVKINKDSGKILETILYDGQGKIIAINGSLGNNQHEAVFNMPFLNSGLYFLKVRTDKNTYLAKFNIAR